MEIAVLTPVLLLLVFVAIHAAAAFYAKSLALAAAEEGARVARHYSGTTSEGVVRAREYLTEVAGDALQDVTISTAGSSTRQVSIQVSGRSLAVIPGLPGIEVRQQAHGPREVVTQP